MFFFFFLANVMNFQILLIAYFPYSIHQLLYSPICWALAPLLEFRNLFTQTVGLLGRESARRKASTYTQDNINTE
jgi:hypothetical protein